MKRKRFLPIWAKAGLPVMVALFFTSCGWECQGIPEELPWFVPYDYAGKTVSFTNGEDTVEVSYDYPSKKMWAYRNYSMSRGRCETRIVQKGCWGGTRNWKPCAIPWRPMNIIIHLFRLS